MNLPELSTKVAASAANAALMAHGIPGGGPVVEALLTTLLQIQDRAVRSDSSDRRES